MVDDPDATPSGGSVDIFQQFVEQMQTKMQSGNGTAFVAVVVSEIKSLSTDTSLWSLIEQIEVGSVGVLVVRVPTMTPTQTPTGVDEKTTVVVKVPIWLVIVIILLGIGVCAVIGWMLFRSRNTSKVFVGENMMSTADVELVVEPNRRNTNGYEF